MLMVVQIFSSLFSSITSHDSKEIQVEENILSLHYYPLVPSQQPQLAIVQHRDIGQGANSFQ